MTEIKEAALQPYLHVCAVASDAAAVGNREGRSITLPKGLAYHRMILCLSGQVIFRLADRVYIAKKGDAILFRPHEPQDYRLGGHYHVYTVDFTGQSVPALLPTALQDGSVCALGGVPAAVRHCAEALYAEHHLGLCRSDDACRAQLLLLLTYLQRASRKELLSPPAEFSKLLPAVASMEQDYAASHTVADYAKLCRLSEYYFIRFFHKYKGSSPLAYRTGVRMRHACRLLAQSELSVAQVAQAVGYDDAVHFSKQFKSQIGQTPRDYRRSAIEKRKNDENL